MLGAILLAAAILPCLFFLGPRTVDHFLLTNAAYGISHGSYRPSPWPQSFRFGMILPLAALQEIFGVRPASAAILTIAASVLHVFATYALARTLFSAATGLVAAAIVTLLPIETIHATLLYPDLLQAALGTLGLSVLVRESRRDPPRSLAILASGLLFAGSYLVKQTVIIPLLFAGGWIAWKRSWRLLLIAVPVAVAVAVESLAIAGVTGNPFYRHTVSNQFLADMNQTTFASAGPVRILLRFPSLLWNPMDRGVPALAGLAFPFAAAAYHLRKEPGVRFLLAAFVLELALMTLWPARLRPFVPALIPDERHLFMLLGPMAAITSEGFLRLGRTPRAGLGVCFGAVCLSITAFIHLYLVRADAGDREAFAELRRQGAASIRAVDIYGNDSALYRYLAGYDPAPKVEPYEIPDLENLKDTWVVVDGRAAIFRPSPPGRVSGTALFAQVPSRWELTWSRSFPEPWDPRRGPPRAYEVRVYRVP
jgi:hypothetical protein